MPDYTSYQPNITLRYGTLEMQSHTYSHRGTYLHTYTFTNSLTHTCTHMHTHTQTYKVPIKLNNLLHTSLSCGELIQQLPELPLAFVSSQLQRAGDTPLCLSLSL